MRRRSRADWLIVGLLVVCFALAVLVAYNVTTGADQSKTANAGEVAAGDNLLAGNAAVTGHVADLTTGLRSSIGMS
ncbi:hypothetical protein B0I33_102607 [Prauserella shujinwangii]|uniref:Uncharacterized protein n=1 Tax=Prauserella shujinwangii TaxID=1453103 RepID=A0A2T0M1M1_9PSEU|nr:hypothetical protein [Prauserella shujinwangii]PRX50485.1 hypothetical protein B0I33_102607 [Prauserella shujinwangii]